MSLLFVCTKQIQAIPTVQTCLYSKCKIAAASVISGAIASGISSYIVTEGFENVPSKAGVIASSILAVLSSFIGYKVTYSFFTPEGKLSCALKIVRSCDQELLEIIKTSSNFEEFNEYIKWQSLGSFYPEMLILEYLEKKRDELFNTEKMIKALDSSFYSHIASEVSYLSNRIRGIIIMCQKGIDLIKSDPNFVLKWQGYMLEKQLNAIKHELSAMKWYMLLGNTSTTHYHYH